MSKRPGGEVTRLFKPRNKASKTDGCDDVGQASLPCSGPETADSHGTDSDHQDALECSLEDPPIIPVTVKKEDIEGILRFGETTEGSSASIDDDDDEACRNDPLEPHADAGNFGYLNPQKPPGPDDLSQSPCEEPVQPCLQKYPGHVVGNTERRFSYKWFRLHEWLEYSVSTDSAFCYCCRHFTITPQHWHKDAFTQSGFRAWNRCSGSDPRNNAFLQHKNSEDHKLAVERYNAYKNLMTASGMTVVDTLDGEHEKQSLISKSTVSVVTFKAVVDELEAEQAAHAKTKAELKKTQDQLELALGEVEVLQKQLARERAQFEKTFLLINKKPTSSKDKLSFSGSESDCQVGGSVSDNCAPEVMHCGVHGSEKRSTTCKSVHIEKPEEARSKEDDVDTSESSEDELNEERAVFTNRSSAPLRSYIQSSHKNAMFRTTSAHTVVGPSCTRGHGNLVKSSFAKPATKLKSNARIVKR